MRFMHRNSLKLMALASGEFHKEIQKRPISVLDVGSRVVANEGFSYSQIFKNGLYRYVGADIAAGKNVDLILKDPYDWSEIRSNSYDVVICGQVLEHSPRFWEVMREMTRVVCPGGFVVVIVPSQGAIHRYPVDCYRFKPDALGSLAEWSGLEVRSLFFDSGSYWGDLMLVARKLKQTGAREISRIELPNHQKWKVTSIPRTRHIGQILISIAALIVGDNYFMKTVNLRNSLRDRLAKRKRKTVKGTAINRIFK